MSPTSFMTLHATVVVATFLGACCNNANTHGDLAATF